MSARTLFSCTSSDLNCEALGPSPYFFLVGVPGVSSMAVRLSCASSSLHHSGPFVIFSPTLISLDSMLLEDIRQRERMEEHLLEGQEAMRELQPEIRHVCLASLASVSRPSYGDGQTVFEICSCSLTLLANSRSRDKVLSSLPGDREQIFVFRKVFRGQHRFKHVAGRDQSVNPRVR